MTAEGPTKIQLYNITFAACGVNPICVRCSCTKYDHTTKDYEKSSICELGKLDLELGRIPTAQDAIDNSIDISKIPENCPNKYLPQDLRPMRMPLKSNSLEQIKCLAEEVIKNRDN